MIARRKHERETALSQHHRRAFGSDLERKARRLQDVGTPAGARGRAIAVLGDRDSGRSNDERSHRGDVERIGVIAAGADDVDDHRQIVLDVQAALAHSARRPDDLFDALALRCERDEQARRLRRRVVPVHDLADERGGLVLGKIFPRNDASQQGRKLRHDAVRTTRGRGSFRRSACRDRSKRIRDETALHARGAGDARCLERRRRRCAR